ncbi:MAG: Zn-ribbon domain-containing OB-fold protein, partial [Candidatus Aminicenantaceae bacterium]
MSTPARYWREIPQRYRLEANKCSSCGKIFFPPRLICNVCQSKDMEKTKLAESGKVITYTIIRVAPHQFVDQAPYAVGIVELDDGVKIMGQIVDCDFEDIKPGLNV